MLTYAVPVVLIGTLLIWAIIIPTVAVCMLVQCFTLNETAQTAAIILFWLLVVLSVAAYVARRYRTSRHATYHRTDSHVTT